MKNDELAVWW